MKRGKCWIFALLLLVPRARVDAVEIKGTVTSSTEKYATVVSDSGLVPTPGDKVSIYFNLAGADEDISVAEGRVYEITGSNIMVEIANATGTIEKGQLARITSEHPQTRSSATPATTPVAVLLPRRSMLLKVRRHRPFRSCRRPSRKLLPR